MKILECPINGPRPISEFVWGGEVRAMPDPTAVSDAEWAAYVFQRDSRPGHKTEWWYHVPSGTWFLAERDVERDGVVRTYLPGAAPGEGSPLPR